MKKVVFTSTSTDDTISLGMRLGTRLREGDIVALIGKLGSGKTCLVQGIAKGLNVSSKEYVRSPSFTIMNIYKGRIPIYHIDLYRVHNDKDIINLGIDEYLYGDGVAILEWADKAYYILKDVSLIVKFYYEDDNRRRLELTGEGDRVKELLWAL